MSTAGLRVPCRLDDVRTLSTHVDYFKQGVLGKVFFAPSAWKPARTSSPSYARKDALSIQIRVSSTGRAKITRSQAVLL